ncbi:MAG: C-type lectin domain-containing protein [Kofleriaceae bacterium]|nr:C-type lectin domain-containing protein [Kofleriaceae bacterium]
MRTLMFVALLATGCLPKTEYKCAANGDCATGGSICEPTGYCSFADTSCASGQRYGELSGSYANQCVDGAGGDAGVDVDGGVDGQPDAPAATCPASYTTMIGTHYYRKITTTATWQAHRTACAADGANAYLAVPDDQAELTSIVMTGGVARVWVGIDDQTTEGTYATVRGGTVAVNSPLWTAGEPDNSALTGAGMGDCVVAVSANRIADDRCDRTYPAVCECEP